MYKHVCMSYLCDYVNLCGKLYGECFLEEYYFDYFMLRKQSLKIILNILLLRMYLRE